MDIKPIPENVRQKIENGSTIPDATSCVLELVYNALDAKATSIAIRVDLKKLFVQVVDNGHGVDGNNLCQMGEMYKTSKCSSADELDSIIETYGYRGCSLASIATICEIMEIQTLSKGSSTLEKVFMRGKPGKVVTSKNARLSCGTTVTLKGLFWDLPVRRHRIKEVFDIEEIYREVEALGMYHAEVSISLRNDSTGKVVFQSRDSTLLKNLYKLVKEEQLLAISGCRNNVTVSGFIAKSLHSDSSLQFVYVNRRLIYSNPIHQLVTSFIEKHGKFWNESRSESETPMNINGYVYFVKIQCSYLKFNILRDWSKKMTISFSDPREIYEVVLRAMRKALTDTNHSLSSINASISHIEWPNQKPEGNPEFGPSQLKGAVLGKRVSRRLFCDPPLQEMVMNQNITQKPLQQRKEADVNFSDIENDSSVVGNDVSGKICNDVGRATSRKRKISDSDANDNENRSPVDSDVVSGVVEECFNNKNSQEPSQKKSKEGSNANKVGNDSSIIGLDVDNGIPGEFFRQEDKEGTGLAENAPIFEMPSIPQVGFHEFYAWLIMNSEKNTQAQQFLQEFLKFKNFKPKPKRAVARNKPKVPIMSLKDKRAEKFNLRNQVILKRIETYFACEKLHSSAGSGSPLYSTWKSHYRQVFQQPDSGNQGLEISQLQNSVENRIRNTGLIESRQGVTNVQQRKAPNRNDYHGPEQSDLLNQTSNKNENRGKIVADAFLNFGVYNSFPRHANASPHRDFIFARPRNGQGMNSLIRRGVSSNIHQVQDIQVSTEISAINNSRQCFPSCNIQESMSNVVDSVQVPSLVAHSQPLLNTNYCVNDESPMGPFLLTGHENSRAQVDISSRNYSKKLSKQVQSQGVQTSKECQEKPTQTTNVSLNDVSTQITFITKSVGLQTTVCKTVDVGTQCDSETNVCLDDSFNHSAIYRRFLVNMELVKGSQPCSSHVGTKDDICSNNIVQARNLADTQSCPWKQSEETHGQSENLPLDSGPSQSQDLPNTLPFPSNEDKKHIVGWNAEEEIPCGQPAPAFIDLTLDSENESIPETSPLLIVEEIVNLTQEVYKTPIDSSAQNHGSQLSIVGTSDRSKVTELALDWQTQEMDASSVISPAGKQRSSVGITCEKRTVLDTDSSYSGYVFGKNVIKKDDGKTTQSRTEEKPSGSEPSLTQSLRQVFGISESQELPCGQSGAAILTTETEKSKPEVTHRTAWEEQVSAAGKTYYVHSASGYTTFNPPATSSRFSFDLREKTPAVPEINIPKGKECTVPALSPSGIAQMRSHLDGDSSNAFVKWHDAKKAREAEASRILAELEGRDTDAGGRAILSATVDKLDAKIQAIVNPVNFSHKSLMNAQVIGQLDKKFIVALLKNPSKMASPMIALFDQHAVDERIQFEALMKKYRPGKNFLSYTLKSPFSLVTDVKTRLMIKKENHIFSSFGLQLRVGRSVIIEAVPTCFQMRHERELRSNRNSSLECLVEQLLKEIAEYLITTRGVGLHLPKSITFVIASEACRSAIKFNQELHLSEMKSMLEKLEDCKLPFQCAHGRPSVIPLYMPDK